MWFYPSFNRSDGVVLGVKKRLKVHNGTVQYCSQWIAHSAGTQDQGVIDKATVMLLRTQQAIGTASHQGVGCSVSKNIGRI